MHLSSKIIATIACLVPTLAFADCKIWHFEDSSAAGQRRASVFASADLDNSNEYVAQGFSIAEDLARTKRLDYIDVFVTRPPQDGHNRNDHSMMSSAAMISYNPWAHTVEQWSPTKSDDFRRPPQQRPF